MSAYQRTLISPGIARSRLAERLSSPTAAEAFLLRYAAAGHIYAQADMTIPKGAAPVRGKRVDREAWAKLKSKAPSTLWTQSTLTTSLCDFIGITFAQEDIDRVADEFGGAPSAPDLRKDKGGRISGKHGEPIATIALRLTLLAEAELNRLTGTALAEDLREEYRRLGYGIPSDTNLASIAVGIIKAVRASSTPQKS